MPSVALVVTLILVLGCNTPAVQGNTCAKEDMKFKGTCYKFVKQPVSWTQAQKFCISKGGNLLHSIDGETKEFLNQHLDQDQAWWVGKDLSNETSKMKPTDPPSWLRGSRVDSFCTYIILDPTLQLVTTSRCNLRLYFVCQKEYEVKIRKRRDSNSTQLQYMNILLNSSATLLSREDLNKMSEFIIKGANSILMSSRSVCPKANASSKEIEILSDLYMKIIDNIEQAKLNATEPGDPPFITNTAFFSSYISSETLQDLGNMNLFISDKQASFILPDVDTMKLKIKTDQAIKIQMMSFKHNPFTWPSKENITGTVASLSMSTAGQQIALSNLTKYIEIILPRPEIQTPPLTFLSTTGNPIIITLNITNPNDTVVVTVEPSITVLLQLHLARGFEPTSTKYHFTTDLSFNKPADYRWLLTPEMLNSGLGTWYLKVTPVDYTEKKNLTFRVMTFTSRCLFWNPGSQDWSADGCKVGIRSQPWEMHCLCNHLTFFASSYFVMPNTVDLSRTAEYFSTINQNYVVVLLVSAFYALYLVTVAWAWWEDRKAVKKRNLTLLTDNNPCAQYRYLLTVYTGHRRGAGTSAKVVVTLIGSEGESDPHHLTDPEKPVFERGGVDMFLLTTPFSLGELQTVRLCHDNSGDCPAWYAVKVVVKNLQTMQRWHFLCNSWIGQGKGTGELQRTFTPAQKNEITSFSNIFHSKTTSGFKDQHIWISVLDPPHRSPFTRVQRVSCCMSLLLCTMAVNIMFWNMPVDPNSPVVFQFTSALVFTSQEIMIGVESALLMFPINILIITIFRSIKPRDPNSKKSKKNDLPKKSPCPQTPSEAFETLLKDTKLLVDALSKNKKNNVPPLDGDLTSGTDFNTALDLIEMFILQLQGEQNPSEPHWIHASRYVCLSLMHVSKGLENVGPEFFPSPEAYNYSANRVKHMVQYLDQVCTKQAPESVISTFFTMLYGFKYGKESSIKWVLSMGLSLFQSIFILQPLKVVGLAIFFALILKRMDDEESDEVEKSLSGETLPINY
ncbi:Polycystic kidney disease protein 1-like 2 [Acipenser ruthenus]|uniref:Polycystic kidney disease protein 1-like 2 n=1 Tax=Acipenser ruthenus TaxID=7906 RepID=A0A444TWE1_ACIRT|nr:Polycystic kidney disease protein 1-like 2 [Acipenser ruthenus]